MAYLEARIILFCVAVKTFWGYVKTWRDGVKWTSDLVSATSKTYNKHGLTLRPEKFFFVSVLSIVIDR